MNWPPLSPDLNPVENLWADMSRIIYRDGKQYNNIQDLHSLILVAWSSITPENLLTMLMECRSVLSTLLKKVVIKSMNNFSFF